MLIYYIFSSILGLLLGSFFNVIGMRVPNKESIVRPPSHCTDCQHRLKGIELIPLFSYFFLKGKCRYCGIRVSPLYPIVEGITALLFGVALFHVGWTMELIYCWLLISLIIIVFVSDVLYMTIPDKILVFFAFAFVLLKIFTPSAGMWWDSLIGAAVGFAVPLIIGLISRGGMGGGDVKYFALIGFVLGWKGVLLSFFFSSFFGSVIGGIGMLTGKVQVGKPMPFAPFIGLGVLTAYFYGDSLLNWYFQLV